MNRPKKPAATALFHVATTLFFAVLLMVAPATAQFDSNSDEPIEISSDTMEWRQDAKIAIARGNADAVQGRYHLHADLLTAHLVRSENDTSADTGAGSGAGSEGSGPGGSANKISLIEAEGNVVLTTPDEMARGERGTYDVKKQIATLTGSVVLTQGENVIRGEHLIMDLVTGRSTLVSTETPAAASDPDAVTAPPGRVRALFAPDTADAPEKAGDNAADGPDAGQSEGSER